MTYQNDEDARLKQTEEEKKFWCKCMIAMMPDVTKMADISRGARKADLMVKEFRKRWQKKQKEIQPKPKTRLITFHRDKTMTYFSGEKGCMVKKATEISKKDLAQLDWHQYETVRKHLPNLKLKERKRRRPVIGICGRRIA